MGGDKTSTRVDPDVFSALPGNFSCRCSWCAAGAATSSASEVAAEFFALVPQPSSSMSATPITWWPATRTTHSPSRSSSSSRGSPKARIDLDIVIAPDPQGAAPRNGGMAGPATAQRRARLASATVALSGGSTPVVDVVRAGRARCPGSATTLFQVDERVAPDGDADRNAGLLEALRPRRASIDLMPVTAEDVDSAAGNTRPLFPIGSTSCTSVSATTATPLRGRPATGGGRRRQSRNVRRIQGPAAYDLSRFLRSMPLDIDSCWRRGKRRHRGGAVVAARHGLPVERVSRTNTIVVLDQLAAARLPYQAR